VIHIAAEIAGFVDSTDVAEVELDSHIRADGFFAKFERFEIGS